MPPAEVARASSHRHIAFVGDSAQRAAYWAALRALGEATPTAHDSGAERHTDLSWTGGDGGGTHVSFIWAPFAQNVAAALELLAGNDGGGGGSGKGGKAEGPAITVIGEKDSSGGGSKGGKSNALPVPDMIIMSSGLWDALHVRSPEEYGKQMEGVAAAAALPALARSLKVWVTTTAVVPQRMPQGDKPKFLTEAKVAR